MSSRVRFTVDDLELTPDDGSRYEIIDGDLYVSTQPQWQHQFVAARIDRQFALWDPGDHQGVCIPAPGLVFARDEAVAPDLVWISREHLHRVVEPRGRLQAAPDLVVEILSPGQANVERDRGLKLKLYSRYGVREYWIVDWPDQVIQVYRHRDGALEVAATLSGTDQLTSPLLPGFSCSVGEICTLPL